MENKFFILAGICAGISTYFTISNHFKLKTIMIDLTKLRSEVENITSVDKAVLQLLQGLADEVANLPAEQTAIDELAGKIRTQADTLSAAVTANTATGTQTQGGGDAGAGAGTGTQTDPNADPNANASGNAADPNADPNAGGGDVDPNADPNAGK